MNNGTLMNKTFGLMNKAIVKLFDLDGKDVVLASILSLGYNPFESMNNGTVEEINREMSSAA